MTDTISIYTTVTSGRRK